MRMLRHSVLAAIAAVMAASAGCTLQSPETPPLTGPSTYALSLTVTASPDILPEDGAAQSVIRIIARDENGQLVRNLPLRVDVVSGGAIVEYGSLSARNLTTNANGEATVVFTAPRSLFPGVDTGSQVTIRVTPVGTDFGATPSSAVRIRLVPQAVVFVPGAPTPSFTFSPTTPRVGDRVFFDASSSTDDGAIVRYQWNYGDGEFEEGPRNFKDYTAAGTYFVTLTVTDNQGKTASLSKQITVVSGS